MSNDDSPTETDQDYFPPGECECPDCDCVREYCYPERICPFCLVGEHMPEPAH